ncbi:unnamed protein product [Caretta caretta]
MAFVGIQTEGEILVSHTKPEQKIFLCLFGEHCQLIAKLPIFIGLQILHCGSPVLPSLGTCRIPSTGLHAEGARRLGLGGGEAGDCSACSYPRS